MLDAVLQHGVIVPAGRALSQVDMMIAATSRLLSATILTTDNDFQAMPDLSIENWLPK